MCCVLCCDHRSDRVIHRSNLCCVQVGLGASMARELVQKFNFSLKSFQRLPHRASHATTKTSKSTAQDPQHLAQAQRTRSLFIELALAFLKLCDAELTRSVLLIKGFVSAILKGLVTDSAEVVANVIHTLQSCVLLHPVRTCPPFSCPSVSGRGC
jgi:hypothetical protein